MNTHTNRRTPGLLSVLTVLSLWTVMLLTAPRLAPAEEQPAGPAADAQVFPCPTGGTLPTRWPVRMPFRAAT